MKNLAILSFLLSFFLISCGDDSGSSADDLNEESELSSSSSEKANKSDKSSNSSNEKANEMELNNDSPKDGDVRWMTWQNPDGYGSGTYCQVYDDTTWRDGDALNECMSDFGGCTKKRENKKIKLLDGYYICQNKTWKWVSVSKDSIYLEMDIENKLDTLGWKDTTEGAIRKGNETDAIYIFDNKKWRVATLPEASLGGCNEKNENFFGYAEMRIWQNFIKGPNSAGYYICRKEGSRNSFYWEHMDVTYYNSILCNDSSYYASSKVGDAHWGSIEPVKGKCINCKQENFDYLENICKKRCYVDDGANRYYLGMQKIGVWRIGDASECALGFGGCTESRFGTIKEGPVIKTEISSDYLGDESYIYYSYMTSIDSTQKRTYICRYSYSEGEDYFPTRWYIASDIDIELAPKLCDDWWYSKGVLISGKNNNKYVCDDGGFRIATQEEIEEGIACTEYNMYGLEKCGSELEKQTGMTCAEYMRLVEKCRAKRKE